MIHTPRRALSASLALAVLALAACGGDDETTTTVTTGATGATGALGASGADYDITVDEFTDELQPEKAQILEAFAADNPECEDVDVDKGFVLLISANAIDADPNAPLESIITDEC